MDLASLLQAGCNITSGFNPEWVSTGERQRCDFCTQAQRMKKREGSWEEACDGCTEGGVGLTLLRPRAEMLRSAWCYSLRSKCAERLQLSTYTFNIVFSFLEQSIWITLLGLTHIKTGKNCPSDTKGHICKTDMLSPLTRRMYIRDRFWRPRNNFQNLCQTSLQWISKLNTSMPHVVNRWISLKIPTAEKAGSFRFHKESGGKCQPTQNHPEEGNSQLIHKTISSTWLQENHITLFEESVI